MGALPDGDLAAAHGARRASTAPAQEEAGAQEAAQEEGRGGGGRGRGSVLGVPNPAPAPADGRQEPPQDDGRVPKVRLGWLGSD